MRRDRGQRLDYFFLQAKKKNYHSRAAFKLLEIQKKYNILKKNDFILDVGCSPGSWSQVCRLYSSNIYAVDILPIKKTEDVKYTFLDICSQDEFALSNTYKEFQFDVIISDAACNTTGDPMINHYRTVHLNEVVIKNLFNILKIDGNFTLKTFHGELTKDLIVKLRKLFQSVSVFKPESSRNNSREHYIVCKKYIRE